MCHTEEHNEYTKAKGKKKDELQQQTLVSSDEINSPKTAKKKKDNQQNEQKRPISIWAGHNLPVTLTANQWALLEKIITILAPFEELNRPISSSTSSAAEALGHSAETPACLGEWRGNWYKNHEDNPSIKICVKIIPI